MPVSSVSRELALVIERVEAQARRDHYARATPEDRAALGIRTCELDGALVLAVDRDESLLLNRVLGLGLATPVTEHALDELLAHYTARPAELGPPTGFAINLSPFAAPAGIERSLERRGFRTFFHHLKWVREDSPAPEARTELRIECVPAAGATAWTEVSARVHASSPAHVAWDRRTVGQSGWSHYVAYDGAEGVAVGALFVHDGAAWLGGAATLEAHRGRGAQGALLARRIRDAIQQGARRLTLETAPAWPHLPGESLRNAARAGFYPAYQRPSWIWPVPS